MSGNERVERASASNERRGGEEAARFYEERRGDATLWSEQPTPAKVKKERMVVFSLRLPAEELEMLRREAEARSLSVSELLRRAVADMLEQERRKAVRTEIRESATQRTFAMEPPRIAIAREPATSGSPIR